MELLPEDLVLVRVQELLINGSKVPIRLGASFDKLVFMLQAVDK